MFGVNGGEALLLLFVAVVVVGPARLPRYAQLLGAMARRVRAWVQQARLTADEELGADAPGVDWRALDPRQYEPRRVVREAFLDDVTRSTTTATAKTRSTNGQAG